MMLMAGDLVTVNLATSISLYAEPFKADEQGRTVSRLDSGETAIVVSLSNHDGRCVCVVGPHGIGWTFGALLKKVK